MAKAHKEWTVLDHGPLVPLEDNLWIVDGALPGMGLRRSMVVARMSDGRLVIHNSIALSDDGMKELDALGEVAFVLVPNGFHRLDAPSFAKRYPNAQVLCPPGARKKVEQVVPVAGTYQSFPEDNAVSLEVLAGLNGAEGIMKVAHNGQLTLVFNDTLFNLPHGSGLEGVIMRLIGSSGEPKVTRVMRWFFVKNKQKLAAHLRLLASTPGLVRLVPGHGKVIDESATQVLAKIADAL